MNKDERHCPENNWVSGFLYILAQDHIPFGKIEEIMLRMRSSNGAPQRIDFDKNDPLGKWAEEAAKELVQNGEKKAV